MKQNENSVSIFALGEEINPDDHFIRLRITEINPQNNTLEAVVIKAEDQFSESRGGEHGHPQDGFQVGMKLVFTQISPMEWSPKETSGRCPNIPWFSLVVQEGEIKRFKHYR